MPYDEGLAERVRAIVGRRADVHERKMFGGVGWLIGGNICAAIRGDELLARVDPEDDDALASEDGVHRMEMRGRELRGWLLVPPEALTDDAALERWVRIGEEYAARLPAK